MESEVNRNIEEQLSAFLDGELPEDELQLLVRRLERDDEHRATLARYARIGGMLRNDESQQLADRLRANVMTALENDPDVSDAATSVTAKSGRPGWYKPAIAAAVSAFAVAGLLNLTLAPNETLDPVQVQQVANDAPAGEASRLVPAASTEAASAAAARRAANQERMLSYLVSHGEYTRSFQGAMTGSRVFVQQASFEE